MSIACDSRTRPQSYSGPHSQSAHVLPMTAWPCDSCVGVPAPHESEGIQSLGRHLTTPASPQQAQHMTLRITPRISCRIRCRITSQYDNVIHQMGGALPSHCWKLAPGRIRAPGDISRRKLGQVRPYIQSIEIHGVGHSVHVLQIASLASPGMHAPEGRTQGAQLGHSSPIVAVRACCAHICYVGRQQLCMY